ncbi:hypothetical protein Tco_1257977, partial [Tanacetum coccineum]
SDTAASRNRPAVNSAGRPKPTARVGHPAGWSKRPAPVSAGRPVSAGWLDPAASRNRPAVNSAGRPKPTERVGQPAGWSKRPAPISAGWLNPAARPYFRPPYVTLGGIKDHNFGGVQE